MNEENFVLIIRRISHAAKKDTDKNLKKWDLTMSQDLVLEYMNSAPEGEVTQRAIEQHFNLQHPTVSGILKRLEKNGFITTSPSPADRRAKNIVITDKAKQLDTRAKMHQAKQEEAFLKGFSPEEKETLRLLLNRVARNISGEQYISGDKGG